MERGDMLEVFYDELSCRFLFSTKEQIKRAIRLLNEYKDKRACRIVINDVYCLIGLNRVSWDKVVYWPKGKSILVEFKKSYALGEEYTVIHLEGYETTVK